jgi:hypothetical protein
LKNETIEILETRKRLSLNEAEKQSKIGEILGKVERIEQKLLTLFY